MDRGRSFYVAWAVLAAAFALPMTAHANIVWEDYQGRSGVFGTSNQDKPGPDYENNSTPPEDDLPNLRTIAANIANATRTGTDATIDYASTSGTLCNTSNSSAGAGYDAAGTGAACQADAQGRVMYALIKFPQAGSYTMSVAHDDEVDLDLSSNYSSTAYRSASYDLPVASASGFTGETTFEDLGAVTAPAANSCTLLRLYWNNRGGQTHLHLRWTKPNSTVEIVPGSQLFDPGVASSATGCVGSITAAGTSITLNKVVAASGRVTAADQFMVAIANNSSGAIAANATTSGSGTGQQASTGAAAVGVGTLYRLTDSMAAGSANTIASYVPTIACTRNGTAFTPGGAAPSWTTSAAANDQVVCTITNTRQPPLAVAKTTYPIYDPVNVTTNPKFVPGGALQYVVTVTNPGAAVTTNTLVITDPVPASLRMFVGNIGGTGKPVVFYDGAPSSTLTFTFTSLSSTTDDVDFSNNGGVSWTYTPVPDGQNYDAAVTNVRIRPKGSMAAGSSAQFLFQAALD